jgi:hypothetical protein
LSFAAAPFGRLRISIPAGRLVVLSLFESVVEGGSEASVSPDAGVSGGFGSVGFGFARYRNYVREVFP